MLNEIDLPIDQDLDWFGDNPLRRHRVRFSTRSEIAAVRRFGHVGADVVGFVTAVRLVNDELCVRQIFPVKEPPPIAPDAIDEAEARKLFDMVLGEDAP